MPAQVDLHMHTTASDGRLTPPELVRLLARNGLRFVAITDHDSTEGLAAAQEEALAHPGLELIPGVELGADIPEGDVHILGYFIDLESEELQTTLQDFRGGRDERGRRMVERLAEIGLAVEWSRVEELAQGGAIARPHIAQALVERGHVETMQEAFNKYLGKGCPAYVSRSKLSPEDAIRLILRFGGLPVLAHPARYVKNLHTYLPSFVEAGLVGMEVYYKDYTVEEVAWLQRLCHRYELIPCGGSDYHANGSADEVAPGSVGPPLASITRLKALLS